MTVNLQDLIDARRLCADVMADLDVAIARAKCQHPVTVDYTVTARTIVDKAGKVLYRFEQTAGPFVTFPKRRNLRDWHRERLYNFAEAVHGKNQ